MYENFAPDYISVLEAFSHFSASAAIDWHGGGIVSVWPLPKRRIFMAQDYPVKININTAILKNIEKNKSSGAYLEVFNEF